MQEPINEVPKTRVRICIFPKIARVVQTAVPVDHKIDAILNTIGWALLKIKRRIVRTTRSEIVEIREISFVAFVELL